MSIWIGKPDIKSRCQLVISYQGKKAENKNDLSHKSPNPIISMGPTSSYKTPSKGSTNFPNNTSTLGTKCSNGWAIGTSYNPHTFTIWNMKSIIRCLKGSKKSKRSDITKEVRKLWSRHEVCHLDCGERFTEKQKCQAWPYSLYVYNVFYINKMSQNETVHRVVKHYIDTKNGKVWITEENYP